MSPRMVQRRQVQRRRSLIEIHPLQSWSSWAAQPVAEHQDANADQNQRPKPSYPVKRKPTEIVQEKKHTEGDQNDGSYRAILAPGLQRVNRRFAEIPGPRGAHGIKSHVKNKTSKQKREQDIGAIADIAAQAHDHGSEHHDMNQRLVILAVVNGAKSRKKAKNKSNAGTAGGTAYGGRSRQGGCGNFRARRCRRSYSRNSHDAGEAIFAIENIAHRANARRAHGLAAVAAVTDGVHIGMDGTLHGIL